MPDASDLSKLDPAELTTLFDAGFDGFIGLKYEVLEPDLVRGSWIVTPSLHQPAGIQHGGVYCAVVESLASVGGSIWLADRGHVVGVNNNTDFLRATREGKLDAVATPIHRGRTQQLWQVSITNADDKLVAKGQVRLANIANTGVLGN